VAGLRARNGEFAWSRPPADVAIANAVRAGTDQAQAMQPVAHSRQVCQRIRRGRRAGLPVDGEFDNAFIGL